MKGTWHYEKKEYLFITVHCDDGFEHTNINMTAWFVMNYALNYPAHIDPSWHMPWTDETITYENDQLEKKRFVKGIASVSNNYGLYPTVLNEPAPNNELVNNIINGRPCILRMTTRSVDIDHTIVLCGYTIIGESIQWCIWNPWLDHYEHFPANGAYVPSGHNASTHTLYHRMTAYNF